MDFDFFFCIPILFGCKTTTSPEGDQQPRICPRCHNAAVISAKQRNWFDVCWVPLFPTSTKHVWMCNICQWTLNRQNGGWEPQIAGTYPPQMQWQGPPQQQWQGQWGPPPGPQYGVGYQQGYAPKPQ